jgi:histidinol-phosphate/aromatic aminotransferase/cobyric acid decarboxylase-like protein
VSFPLGDWVLDHPHVPHNLAISGMKGMLPSVSSALSDPAPATPEELRRSLARLHGVPSDRVFLTHGASEANALILLFLARHSKHRTGRPRIHTPVPEYPPLRDAAREVGFAPVSDPEGADAVALSSPRNPMGTRVDVEVIRALAESKRPVLVDQTFREFTEEPPVTRLGLPTVWLSGSFTKVYGADDLRVGYAIAPGGDRAEFARMHGLLLDRLPPRSVGGAVAILASRAPILSEVRGLFRANVAALRKRVGPLPELAAPVWFDRGRRGLDGDRLAQRLLRAGVLVCSGSFFGDPRGIRLTLTRRTFPSDLEAYLRLVDRS